MIDLRPAHRPERVLLNGRLMRLEPLDAARHGEELWEGTHGSEEKDALWRYMSDGPFPDRAAFQAALEQKAASSDPLYFAIVAASRALGWAAYLRIQPSDRVIEVGSIVFGVELQRTPAATEAMYLMARHVFEDLGYRRYEWKCDAENTPSRRAALRFGYTFEGIFRQHMIVKGRNRDTAWYSMLDREWPERKRAFEDWLDPSNFDETGKQRRTLREI